VRGSPGSSIATPRRACFSRCASQHRPTISPPTLSRRSHPQHFVTRTAATPRNLSHKWSCANNGNVGAHARQRCSPGLRAGCSYTRTQSAGNTPAPRLSGSGPTTTPAHQSDPNGRWVTSTTSPGTSASSPGTTAGGARTVTARSRNGWPPPPPRPCCRRPASAAPAPSSCGRPCARGGSRGRRQHRWIYRAHSCRSRDSIVTSWGPVPRVASSQLALGLPARGSCERAQRR
jgi:hypothetical protein